MALLTSYKVGGIELNDGLNYAVPGSGLELDSLNPTDEGFAYFTGGDLPLSTGVTVKEGSVAFNIHIVANTAESFETKLAVLKSLFNTREPTYIKLERKLPHEQYYRYVMVRPAQFVVSRIERKVGITLTIIDRAWKNDTWQQVTTTLFADAARTVDVPVQYDGTVPVEPIVQVTTLTAGSDGPIPLYYYETTVYASSVQHIINTPIQLKASWDVSALISQGKMRSDSLDVSVSLPDGTKLRRYIGGTSTARYLWTCPQTWPTLPAQARIIGAVNTGITAAATEVPVYAHTGTLASIPTAGKFSIGDEIIAYTGFTFTTEDKKNGKFTGCSRGQDGTTATNWDTTGAFNWIKWPVTLKVGFGYAAGYTGTYFANDLSAWPLIDLDISDNKVWTQSVATTSPWPTGQMGYFCGRPLSWRSLCWLPLRPGDWVERGWNGSIEGGTGKMKLRANRVSSSPNYPSYRERLVMQLLPYGSRMVSQAKFLYTLKSGDAGQFPTIKSQVGATRDRFDYGYGIMPDGTPYSMEFYKELHTASLGGLSQTQQFDTGWCSKVSQDYNGATHLWAWVTEAPTCSYGTPYYGELVIDRVDLLMDQMFFDWPTVYWNGSMKGYGVAEFPVCMSWQNLTDTVDNEAFSIWPMSDENRVITYDCSTYDVTNAPLSACNYDHPKWLRLMPGANTIRFIGTQGIGQVTVTIKWQNRT